MFSVETSGDFKGLVSLDKQLKFATAKTLTQTVKLAQAEGIEEIKRELKPRSEWYLPSRAPGVRVRTADKNNLRAELYSNADWLAKLATGETHTPSGGRQSVAVPTRAIQPTGREVIARAKRPRNLKNAFVIKARSGQRLLVKRAGRALEVLYVLKKSTRRPTKNPLIVAAKRVVSERVGPLFSQNLADALRTAK